MAGHLSRYEGRLFSEDGCLFMVVHADESAGIARVSCRVGSETQVVEMPFTDMARRVASSGNLALDNLNGPAFDKRLLQKKDGWHIATREGVMGPYESEQDAARQLSRHILRMQTEPPPSAVAQPTAAPKRSAGRSSGQDRRQRAAAA